ncbi:MAG: polyprenyl synthetase family protein [Phocaeicola sp.]|nr:polyprenyl synthetase family protein [Phocaeicola sp.]MDD7448526.1 polyprenyl synthetase family protein [Prevotellaceae bacterium]MDY3913383.1 polyprenyl synthetase family protein [Phocaeicola sp.]MDY5939801.1 polyprenyl synthetase family protein [Phocaeicola sp.]
MKQFTANELLDSFSQYISQLTYAKEPYALYAPIDYVLPTGGKRVRPILMLLAYNLYKEDITTIFSQATALETYHNFTLLHDDLMDGADMRRGIPTVHKKWNANTAILSGDAMLILANQLMLIDCPTDKLAAVLKEFMQAEMEVCEGQQWDVDFEERTDVSIEEYIEMIRLKTSVLLGVALKIGAILGGASVEDAQHLYDFGIKMGLSFQLQDDYLDVYGDPKTFGKMIGGDILNNKKTFMLITALERAEGEDAIALKKWISSKDFQPEEKIKAVTEIYNRLDIPALCQEKMNALYEEGLALLNKVSVTPSRKTELRTYVERLMKRNK